MVFVLLVFCTNGFSAVKSTLNSWNEFHLIMCIILFIHFLIWFANIFWGFLYLYSQGMLVWVFFSCDVSVWLWYQGGGGLVEWVSECSSLCYILEEFDKDRCYFSKCLIEFVCEAIWSWASVSCKTLNHSLNFSACDWSIYIFYFFLVQFWKVVLF